MGSSDVCPTEDSLNAFLEYLVDPVLPAKPSTRDNLPPSQQHLVAKQVHSVVLLYNYYHRKQHPELEFLSFVEFFKLALVLRPTLSVHMKFMLKPGETEPVDLEQLSLTEDKIFSACNICTCLDASRSVPDVEGWPISKVAVLLVDSKKENCFLRFSSITEGVWSVVEKDVDTFSQNSEKASGARYKKSRVIKKPTKNEFNSEEDGILQIAYFAVKEAAGINKTDITFLESYTVYSQSKAKTASRFYIMKCSQLINKKLNQPIKSLIKSLQGPLVKRSSNSWTVTSAVEYFHVLPYSEIILDWISSETVSNSLQGSKLAEKNMMVSRLEVTESYTISEDKSIGLNVKLSSDAIEPINQNKNNGSCAVTCSASIKDARDVYVDNTLASPSKNKEECQNIANTLQVNEDQEIENPSVKAENGDSTRMLITEGGTKDQSTCVSKGKTVSQTAKASFENDSTKECALVAYNPNSDHEKLQTIASKGKTLSQIAKASSENDSIEECSLIANYSNSDLDKLQIIASKGMTLSQMAKAHSIDEHALITNNPNSDLEKLQILIASKGKTLSQTALNALVQKRNALALQQRMIEDEITLCDKKIQRITSGEDDLKLNIESLIEGCNDTWVRNQGRMCQHLEDQCLPPYGKRRRLTEAVLILQSPCKELDGICHENSWLLPIYHVSELNGGFQANVAVKGLDFECSFGGSLCSHPHEARDSAAAQMLANLRSMAKSGQ